MHEDIAPDDWHAARPNDITTAHLNTLCFKRWPPERSTAQRADKIDIADPLQFLEHVSEDASVNRLFVTQPPTARVGFRCCDMDARYDIITWEIENQDGVTVGDVLRSIREKLKEFEGSEWYLAQVIVGLTLCLKEEEAESTLTYQSVDDERNSPEFCYSDQEE